MSTGLPPDFFNHPEDTVEAAEYPVEVELAAGAPLPGVRAVARVHLHRMPTAKGPILCWSYVTEGLSALAPFGQKEVVITVAVGPGADPRRYPADPLNLARLLASTAPLGGAMGAGDITILGGEGFMGFRALTYAPAVPLGDLQVPAGTLALVALKDEESSVYQACGPTRVLSALGNAYRHYPFPPWFDRGREAVTSPAQLQGSILTMVPRVAIPGSARMEGRNVLLRLRAEAADTLNAKLVVPPDAGFALTTEVDPEGDGCLVWQAGQTAPSAITPPGSRGERLSGCFVLIVPEQTEDTGELREDGFAFLLTSTSTARLREALVKGQPLAIPGAGGKMGLTLEWVSTSAEVPAWATPQLAAPPPAPMMSATPAVAPIPHPQAAPPAGGKIAAIVIAVLVVLAILGTAAAFALGAFDPDAPPTKSHPAAKPRPAAPPRR